MFKDDRLISILSGVVLMIAIGTVVQRGDLLVDYFAAGKPPPQLERDEITAMANDLVRINVLANDTNLSARDRDRLVIAAAPECGRVFIQEGFVQYLPVSGCEGQQVIRYTIEGEDPSVSGEVVATVIPAPETVRQVRAEPAKAPDTAPKLAKAPAPAQPSLQLSGIGSLSHPDTAPVAPAPNVTAPTALQPTAPQAPTALVQVAPEPAPSAPIASAAPTRVDRAPARVDIAGLQPMEAPDTKNLGELSHVALAIPRESLAAEEPALRMTSPTQPMPAAPARAPSNDIAFARAPETGDQQPVRNAPDGMQVMASVSLARIDREAAASAIAPEAPTLVNNPNPLDQIVPRVSMPEIGSEDTAQVALAAPTSGLGPVLSIGRALSLTPVDTSEPAALAEPRGIADQVETAALNPVDTIAPALPEETQVAEEDPAETPVAAAPAENDPAVQEMPIDPDQVAALPSPTGQIGRTVAAEPEIPIDPDQVATLPKDDQVPVQPVPGVQKAPDIPVEDDSAGIVFDPDQVAGLPQATDQCLTPPALTIEPRPAGQTYLVMVSPCHAGSVAELAYSGLRLAIPIDNAGRGEISVLGFEAESDVTLALPDGEVIEFRMPFQGMQRVNRVALVWDLPVVLDLHAREFGAKFGSRSHVWRGNALSPDTARLIGGGYLQTHNALYGIGQNAQIYTYLSTGGSSAGVIDLQIDFTSRKDDLTDATCGSGLLASPRFTVVRSSKGKLERPIFRRLGSIACNRAKAMKSHLIDGAIGDLIISTR